MHLLRDACHGFEDERQLALRRRLHPPLLRNQISTSNLESMMRVAIEGLDNDFDDILTSALDLWKDVAKFRYWYSNPERYLSGGI